MSYCRLSDKSDVCVWQERSKRIVIYTAYDARPRIPYHGFVQEFVAAGPMQAATILLKLRSMGLKVPQSTIDQLVSEARA